MTATIVEMVQGCAEYARSYDLGDVAEATDELAAQLADLEVPPAALTLVSWVAGGQVREIRALAGLLAAARRAAVSEVAVG